LREEILEEFHCKVIKIINEQTVQVEPLWHSHGETGKLVQFYGVRPVFDTETRLPCMKVMNELLVDKYITIKRSCYVANGVLVAVAFFKDKMIPEYFPERVFNLEILSRWDFPSEDKAISKIEGGLPIGWTNPIPQIPPDQDPFFRPIPFPTKPWEDDYLDQKYLADSLYSDTHLNKVELDRTIDKLLNDPKRDGGILIEGEIGIGKSWYLSYTLMNLPKDRYHVIIIDFRFIQKGDSLNASLNRELDKFLEHYITGLNWVYPTMMSYLGDKFNPTDRVQIQQMTEYALRMPIEEKNYYRLNSYALKKYPQLIIVFDNIDQLNSSEQEDLVDYGRRLTGGRSNVKFIFAIRPQTLTIKSRITECYGDGAIKVVNIRCPDIYDILEKRLTHDRNGNSWSLDNKIPNSNWSWRDVLKRYRESEQWGSAGFIRGLCSTYKINNRELFTTNIDRKEENQALLDIRHYQKLFIRLLRSNVLNDFKNIDSLYYCVHALMIRNGGHMDESESYLFNLFDNEQPWQPGNAIIRYRVLEYFSLFKLADKAFDDFFDALGYSSQNAREVLQDFIDAGLIDVYFNQKTRQTIGELTIPGKRQMEIVLNLWYIICIKTGMNIYTEYIRYGEEAKSIAKKFVNSNILLEHYGRQGWVPEMDFANYIYDQVHLEKIRLSNFLDNNQDDNLSKRIQSMYSKVSNIGENLAYAINNQLVLWERKQSEYGSKES
jgi:hypothetical protein